MTTFSKVRTSLVTMLGAVLIAGISLATATGPALFA